MSAGDFTKVNLRDEVPDMAGQSGVEGLAAHFAAGPLELQKSGLSYQRLEPGQRQPWGHRHKTQEEIYVVVAGAGKAKLGDEDVEVGELDAIRVGPELARNFEAGPDGLALLAFGAPRPPDQQPGGDAEMLPGWWGDEDF
ncbi:MAG TPA: cupin domain-containing protein [Solirubrobacterales bacterium]|nr:cupin domain-containing protein [Solirubrobacterales bacterium]